MALNDKANRHIEGTSIANTLQRDSDGVSKATSSSVLLPAVNVGG